MGVATGIEFAKQLEALGSGVEGGGPLAGRLQRFAEEVQMVRGDRSLQEEHTKIRLGMKRPIDFDGFAVGQTFLSVWNIGTGDGTTQVPLTIRLAMGSGTQKPADTMLLNIRYMDVAELDIHTGEIKPLVDQPVGNSTIPIDHYMLLQ